MVAHGWYTDLVYRHYLLGDHKKAEQMAIKCKFRNRQAGKVCGKAAKGESPKLAKGKGSRGRGSPGKAQEQNRSKGGGG